MSLQQPADIGALMSALGCENPKAPRLTDACGNSSPRLFDLSMEFSLFGGGDDSVEETPWTRGSGAEDFQGRRPSLLRKQLSQVTSGNGE